MSGERNRINKRESVCFLPLYAVDFAANGNMNTKTGVGTYEYNTGDAGPHAVSRITEPATDYLAMAKINKQDITYTGFDKTSTIWQGNPDTPEAADYLQITYGPGQSRKKITHYKAGVQVKTKTFVDGSYEIEEDADHNLRHLHYISGGDGLFAIYVMDKSGKDKMYYIHKDYQGSYETITDKQGTVIEKLSYDPWGRRRNPTNWTFTDVPETYKFDRGYTGHEHLDAFGLINMNGRMYDPMLGRFLSPDNYVQAPDYTQNFNRYSYVMNNPLKYTDPSGEWIHIVIGAAIGGILNWATHGAQFNAEGLGYFGVGALAGALAAGIGAGVGAALAGNAAAGGGFAAGFAGTATISSTGFAAGAISGAAAGVTNGLVMGTGNGMLADMSFSEAFVNEGLDQAWKQGIGGVVFGGIMGTLDALYSKEDWLTGSPYKKFGITDGNNVSTRGAAKVGSAKNAGVLELPETSDSYSIEIKAPNGWEMTNGYAMGGSKGGEIYPSIRLTEHNSQIIDFPIGTPHGGYYGAQVSRPLRLLNHNQNLKWFYSNSREFSTLFWYLSFIKKN